MENTVAYNIYRFYFRDNKTKSFAAQDIHHALTLALFDGFLPEDILQISLVKAAVDAGVPNPETLVNPFEILENLANNAWYGAYEADGIIKNSKGEEIVRLPDILSRLAQMQADIDALEETVQGMG